MAGNLRHAERYNIGLDIGTGSVGWAVTDENGELYHFKRKPTWGSRLFPSAEPASVARAPRGQRRRYDRRRQRLDLLQEFFASEMASTDSEFFIRLRQSRLLPEDREQGHSDYRWPLFNGSDFTESDYYAKFPTIYHLRKWLMEADEQADIRLIYLAFHNIVKTRGNFLHQDNPSLGAKSANMGDSIKRLCETLEEWCEERDLDPKCQPRKMQSVLEDVSNKRAEKREQLVPLFGFDAEGKKRAKEIAGAILGYKVDFGLIFEIEGENLKFDFGNDDAIDGFLSICPDDAAALFESIRAAYSSYVLMGILKGADGQTISYCKVREYERYAKDLKTLKALVRDYVPAKYDSFFRGPHYEAPWQKDYDAKKAEGYTLYNLGTSKLSYEDFKKDVKKLFAGTGAESDERYKSMIQSFDDGEFLRRLKTSDNGSIPYQLHLEEMDAIIDRQGAFYPFLKENREKIESLVKFRIPYYVGPLTTKNARRVGDDPQGDLRFAWSERQAGKESERIYPWNWEDVIDKDKSAENFIRRMTGTCTYLKGEPVLPRCSLLYEKFCVLNELNGARWSQDGDDERRFCASDRAGIYEDLFKHGTVSYKKVEEWLSQHHRSHPHVRGGQGETKFESKLSSHLFFCKTLEVDDLEGETAVMVENLILWNTLFEDRDILKEKVRREYGDRLTDAQIKQICKKRFTGWGRLSEKLLCGLKAETAGGLMSIMDILEDGNPEGKHVGSAMILMEILHDEHFGFEKLIDEFNMEKARSEGGLSIDDLPGSPALRRSVNQAMRIVAEIVSIAGGPPANIFIEVTRDDDQKKKGRRTTRRFDNLKEALAGLKAEGAESLSELKRVGAEGLDAALSLYFMQNAKCMYCGEALDIRHVMSGDHSYQIDHIIPQSYVKDDSFENRVLVHAHCNQSKSDALLIDSAIRRKMRPYWRALFDAGLIGEKKYRNLMRDRISEKQMQGFINRQLVETSQIVKFVRMMLAEAYPDTRIESIKASLSHQLREERGFVKCREANNYHHAHDALLAAEIGRFIQLRHGNLFENPIAATHAMRSFVKAQSERYRKTRKMPGSASFIIASFLTSGFDKETGEVFKDAWDAEAECEKIRRFLNYKDCYISRMPEVTSGAFWDATIYSPKGTSKKLSLPLKKGLDPSKYGSYSGEQFAYFFMFAADDQKGRPKVFFNGVPLSLASSIEAGIASLVEYAESIAPEGSKDIRVLREKIYKYQMIEYGSDRFFVPALDVVYSAREIALSKRSLDAVYAIEQAQKRDGQEVNDDLLLHLYEEIANRIYSICSRFANIQTTLLENKGQFVEAENRDKQMLLLGLLRLMRANKVRVNLRLVSGSANAAGITNGFLTNDTANVVFVDQSVTGMFERRQRLEL